MMSETIPPEKRIPVVEMFGPTVQGEGAVIGQQTYFIRFGLCDYRCTQCDSMHAVDPNLVKANAKWLSCQEIFDQFIRFRKEGTTKNVTFSGGNPCIHNLDKLADDLHEAGYKVHVETQGTFCPYWLWHCSSVCVSPKGPGMGERLEMNRLDTFISAFQRHRGLYLKFVLFDQRDVETASMLYERYVLPGALGPEQFFLSLGNPWPPSNDGQSKPTLDEHRRFLCERYTSLLEDIAGDKNLSNVRFLPQLHVLLWGNKQGV